MSVIEIEIPSEAIRLTGIVDIRNWLLNAELDSRACPVSLGQFALDWIEEKVGRAIDILESDEIATDDESFKGAIHYEVDTILDVIRTDAPCYQFFKDLESLTRTRQ